MFFIQIFLRGHQHLALQKLFQRLVFDITTLREVSTEFKRSLDEEPIESQDSSKQKMVWLCYV